MKRTLLTALVLIGTMACRAQQPAYLDETLPIEQRVDDALQRMTLDEKIAVIHARHSPVWPPLGTPAWPCSTDSRWARKPSTAART